jgi:Na+/serine symporter
MTGGFVVGLLMGMLLAPMRPMATKKVRLITWILRCVALALLIVLFAVSIREFYSSEDPSKVREIFGYLYCTQRVFFF